MSLSYISLAVWRQNEALPLSDDIIHFLFHKTILVITII